MSLAFACILVVSSPVLAQDNPPSFNGGASQNMPACINGGPTSLNSILAVNDLDGGQTETWSVTAAPLHGTLSGFDATAISTGGLVFPTGVSYTPATGYTGGDTFSVQVSDGILSATTTVFVTVYPLPILSSTLSPAAICDGSVFSYTPTSATGGATFSWTRPYIGGLSNAAASGTGSVSEALMNITNYDVPVTYMYTTTAHGCSSHQNVVVTVHASPRLASATFDTTCTGGTYTYVPLATPAGTTFSWTRVSVAGISPAASSGTGNISEVLTSTDSVPVTVQYTFTLSIGGCTATRNLNVTVLPTAPITSITTASPATVCAGTMFQNFGAGIAPPAGASYSWSAVNAQVFAVGNNGQYALVNFPNEGDASVSLNVIMAGAHCANSGTYAVTVGPAGISTPADILYYNYQLIYQDNTQDSYQWGYDNAATLDSTAIPGAVFQSYPFGSSTPDFVNNYYWVITTRSGCMQKTYYNGPTAVPATRPVSETMQVYPNPAHNTLDIFLITASSSISEVAVTNVLGQVVKTINTAGQKIRMDISDLPSGCYLVSCSQNGLKLVTSRFIKN